MLCLQLTDVAMSIASQKPENKPGREPTLVRLSKGEVQEKCSIALGQILQTLIVDQDLCLTSAVSALLVTHAHILSRFSDYDAYPFKLWTLTARFNDDGHVHAIESFLDEPACNLDTGYSLFLQKEALAQESRASAMSHPL